MNTNRNQMDCRRLKLTSLLAAVVMASAGVECPDNGNMPGSGFPRTTPWVQTTVHDDAGVRPAAIHVADFDGDELLDVAVGYAGLDSEPARIVILFQQDDGTVSSSGLLQGDSVAGVSRLTAGDLNGDDRPDVIAACGERIVYLRSPTDPRQGADWQGFEIEQTNGDGIGQWNDVAVANIDGANGPDIVACGQDAGRVSWFRSPAAGIADGAGWQRIDIDDESREGAASIAVGDVNGDGRVDVYSTAPGEEEDRVAWYQNPSNAVTQAWTKFAIGNLPAATRLAIGDLNADGRVDVIVTNPPGRQVAWYQRPADPSADWSGFLITQYTAATPVDIGVADVDGNSQPDVIISTRSPGSLRWFTPIGVQTNQWLENQVIDLASGLDAGRIVLADFDGDNRRDVFGCVLGANTNQDLVGRWDNPE